jgi:von Willebrand factor type A domain/Vault protein inter-alpha-trypsin domain
MSTTRPPIAKVTSPVTSLVTSLVLWAGVSLLMGGWPRSAAARVPALVDGRYGHQVKEITHNVYAKVTGLTAQTTVTRSLRSTSGSPEEGIVNFRTPPGSVVVSLWVRLGRRWVKGALLDAKAVRRVVKITRGLPNKFDPAWLEMTGVNRYRLRVYPVPPKGSISVRYSYVHPVTLRWGQRVFVYPRRGSARNLATAWVTLADRPVFSRRARRYKLRVVAKTTLEKPLSDLAIGATQPVRAALFVTPPQQVGEKAPRLKNPGHALLLVQGNPGASRRRWGTDVVFLVDRSRSMWPHSHRTVSAVIRRILKTLGRRTRFGVVAYHRKAKRITSRLTWAKPGTVTRALRGLARTPLANGTRLADGLRKSYSLWSKRTSARRRLLVILTDGLLPERETSGIVWPTAPKGTEVLILQGRPFSGITHQLRRGPLATLARQRGGVAYAFDPRAHEDGSAAGDKASHQAAAKLAASLARPGRLTDLSLHIGGKKIWLAQKDLALLGGFLQYRKLTGASPTKATLRFGYWGRRRTVHIGARAMPAQWSKRLITLYGASGDRGVYQKRSLVVVNPTDAFGRDRLRFAQRWGGRFFRRMAPPGSLDLPVGPFYKPGATAKAPAATSKQSAGRLTKSIVKRLLTKGYLKRATRCYQATGPRFKKGRAVLYLDLTRGEVTDVWLAHSTLKNPVLHRCLIQAAYALRVARSWGDETLYRVTYPMRFRPSSKSAVELRNWRPPRKRPNLNPLRGLW